MRKSLSFIIAVCMLFNLSGCRGIYSNFREVEQIRIIQTMGLDLSREGILLSLASAGGEREGLEPLFMRHVGVSVSDAMERIKGSCREQELFFAHIKYILIGETAAADGTDGFLSYICRSPELRIDTPLFVIRDMDAAEAMEKLNGPDRGVSEIMQGTRSRLRARGTGQLISAGEIINNISSYGGSLICALRCREASEQGEEELFTLSVDGYGILKGPGLWGYINEEDGAAVAFLLNKVGVFELNIPDAEGRPVSLEITDGGSEAEPVWDEAGELRGINIYAHVSANLLEMEEQGGKSRAETEDFLTAGLESELSDRIGRLLQLERKSQTDFLGLGGQLELKSPEKFRSMKKSFSEALPELTLKVSVSGRLTHGNDIKDS